MKPKIDSIDILGIPVSTESKKEVTDLILQNLEKGEKNIFIATVNPSFVMQSRKNKKFFELLKNKTTLNVADGVGVQLAGEYLSNVKGTNIFNKLFKGVIIGLKNTVLRKDFNVIPDRITGLYLAKVLLKYAEGNNKSVLIILRRDGLTKKEELDSYIMKEYPNLRYKIVSIPLKRYDKVLKNKNNYDVLLCGLGEIKQELFIYNHLPYIEPKIGVGVGGVFDLLTSNVPQTASSLSSIGLDWLGRVLYHPKRVKKVFRSVVLFPLYVFVDSIS